MAITKEDFIKEIESMSVLDLNDLVEALKEKFKVSGAPVMAGGVGGDEKEKGSEEKTSFNIVLKEVGSSKIAVIKEVKSMLGIGLKESKDLIEKADKPLKENVKKEEAEEIKKKLEVAGATIELQ